MGVLRSGVLYFAVVLAAGFVLGPIRLIWVVPRLGARAELKDPAEVVPRHTVGDGE